MMQQWATVIETVQDQKPDSNRKQAQEWLLSVASDRDRKAFESLYTFFAPRVKSYMMKHGAHAELAEDLAQETLAQIWKKASYYDPAKAAPATWIFRIARNLQIDKLRRQKVFEVEWTPQLENIDECTVAQHRSEALSDSERLKGMIRNLPEEQHDVIMLTFFEGLTHTEVGNRLSIPLGTVKSRLRLACGKLRAALGETS